jgi:hypothetical protein
MKNVIAVSDEEFRERSRTLASSAATCSPAPRPESWALQAEMRPSR